VAICFNLWPIVAICFNLWPILLLFAEAANCGNLLQFVANCGQCCLNLWPIRLLNRVLAGVVLLVPNNTGLSLSLGSSSLPSPIHPPPTSATDWCWYQPLVPNCGQSWQMLLVANCGQCCLNVWPILLLFAEKLLLVANLAVVCRRLLQRSYLVCLVFPRASPTPSW
jgi:hypothetical protein